MRGCSGGCAWFYLGGIHGFIRGGMCGFIWGVCMVLFFGGACVVLFGGVVGGCVVLFGGACVVLFGGMRGFIWGHAWFYSGGVCGFFSFFGYNEIRSMSGRYASYWNAFLLKPYFMFGDARKSVT